MLREDFRESGRGLPFTCCEGDSNALLYDAPRFGLEAVLKELFRDCRGRARDRLGVKLFDDIERAVAPGGFFVWVGFACSVLGVLGHTWASLAISITKLGILE